ncbi:hypothetical protein GCM10009676_25810 [Prauserella halophila]|uniref:ANTAR domain-containing protein n=1 Tax=Prauserella halophila TaxID=185641 RepID=A0ABN1WB07_9PSEU|nr:hypothetical protein [Prauserella halophila]MCP2234956.1 hypothetical protein [Prauserella halophila]
MIARDRELLARLGQVNTSLGRAVVALMSAQADGELPVDGVRDLAELLGSMSAELYRRAAELEGGQAPERVVIDAH